ncbi:hypothetical protein [Streptomyces sp. KL116D]
MFAAGACDVTHVVAAETRHRRDGSHATLGDVAQSLTKAIRSLH